MGSCCMQAGCDSLGVKRAAWRRRAFIEQKCNNGAPVGVDVDGRATLSRGLMEVNDHASVTADGRGADPFGLVDQGLDKEHAHAAG